MGLNYSPRTNFVSVFVQCICLIFQLPCDSINNSIWKSSSLFNIISGTTLPLEIFWWYLLLYVGYLSVIVTTNLFSTHSWLLNFFPCRILEFLEETLAAKICRLVEGCKFLEFLVRFHQLLTAVIWLWKIFWILR